MPSKKEDRTVSESILSTNTELTHLLSLETKCLSTITKAQVKYTFFQKKFHYVLSRERVTCFTQLSSDPKIELKSEFVFKDKATQAHLTPPKDV